MIGFKDAEELCSNMLLSIEELLGERSDHPKVLEFLSAQGLTSSVGSATEGTRGSIGNIGSYSGTTSRSVIKARFRSFSMQFEEVCQAQINWAIPERELQDNLILAVAEILLPAYRSFLKRVGPLVENSHNASKYIKYTPETLEQALGNLFAKKSLSEQGHRVHQASY